MESMISKTHENWLFNGNFKMKSIVYVMFRKGQASSCDKAVAAVRWNWK